MSNTIRYHLIDSIRGLTIINMVIFHFMYDIFVVYGNNSDWNNSISIHLWQRTICITMILISGICWRFGSNHIKSGIYLNLAGFLITLVTILFSPKQVIWFGILNFIGCSVLIMCLFHNIFRRLNPYISVIVCISLYLLFANIGKHYIGIGNTPLIIIPDFIYELKVFTFMGAPFDGFYSSDYFPILPWFFIFTAGYFIGHIISLHQSIQTILRYKIPIFNTIGTKSLLIYMVHQPICIVLCSSIFFFNKNI